MKRDPQALEDREHDVLVIGGGIAGAWTAWEAASRGLTTALVELEDFGQATSWSSLKTAHGGLRHLQRLDISGFRESVRERRALLRVAPEIVRPLAFAIPAPRILDKIKFFLGGLVNDVLSADRNDYLTAGESIGISRVVGRAEAAAIGAKAISEGGVFVWHDAQITHTERLLMGILHAASEASAAIVNHCRLDTCVEVARGFELEATDAATGRGLKLRTRSIVNAAGAQLEPVSRLLGTTCGSPLLLRGVNVVLHRPVPTLALGARESDRFLFLVPWLGRSILGTSYDDGQAPVEDLVRQLVEAGQRAFPWAGIDHERIKMVHVGQVPGGPGGEPIYRSRIITHPNPRVLSILTAKYTTARATAEAVVDSLGRVLAADLSPSISAVTPLPMAAPLMGPLAERLKTALETEMALDQAEAYRGRLIEGALGQTPREP